MGKSTNRSSSKSTNSRNSANNNTGRPRPMSYKAGVTKNRTRYGEGGNLCW